MLLTRSFSKTPAPDADVSAVWAIVHERVLRELRYREDHPGEIENVTIVALVNSIPARDAGDVCHVCGDLVTWTDHLPGENEVRCMKNVTPLVFGKDVSPYLDPV